MIHENYVYDAVKKIEPIEIKQAELVYNVEYLPQLDDMDKSVENVVTGIGVFMFAVMFILFVRKRVENVRKEQRTI